MYMKDGKRESRFPDEQQRRCGEGAMTAAAAIKNWVIFYTSFPESKFNSSST